MRGPVHVFDRRRRGRVGTFAAGWRIMALAVVLLVPGEPASAQGGSSDPASGVVAQVVEGGDLPAGGISPLPPPATDRAYLHVFLAFGVAWALILGYVVLLSRRIGAAERDASRLAERVR